MDDICKSNVWNLSIFIGLYNDDVETLDGWLYWKVCQIGVDGSCSKYDIVCVLWHSVYTWITNVILIYVSRIKCGGNSVGIYS